MGKTFWLRKVNCKNLVEVERGQINLNCQESKVVLKRDVMEFFLFRGDRGGFVFFFEKDPLSHYSKRKVWPAFFQLTRLSHLV